MPHSDEIRIGQGLLVAIALVLLSTHYAYPECKKIDDHPQTAGIVCRASSIMPDNPEICSVLPKIYARIKHFPAPVYKGNEEPEPVQPVRFFPKGFVWVSLELEKTISYEGREWMKINSGEFMERRYLAFHSPSTFRGGELHRRKTGLPLIWLILNTTPSGVPGGPMDYNASTIKKYSMFPVKRVVNVDGQKWYEVGKNKWINQKRIALARYRPRPKGVGPGEKWIYVDLYEQTLVAYDGDLPVYATLISSGRKGFPTVNGLFRIWLKVREKKMSGEEDSTDYYYLEDVPWQMYFHKGYAIHTSYWHDRFGIPQSRGCINVSPYDACWLYHWTGPRVGTNGKYCRSSEDNPGTWVYITTQ